MSDIYKMYVELLKEYSVFEENKIPLCAAENYLSDFARNPLSGPFEGKYSMGNKNYDNENDFIGGEYIHKLFELFDIECQKVFSCRYGDGRTLSGMNCLAICLQCVFKRGNRILLTTPQQGGHPSVPIILETLGILYDEMPYDYSRYRLNYQKINFILKTNSYNGVVFCQSDLINFIDLSKIKFTNEIVVFDGTQTLGMIAAKIHPNPLLQYDKTILIGGSHKTLPGPSSGLIMCNDDQLIYKLDVGVSPSFLRNVHPNHIASLLLTLIEFEEIGYKYENKIVENANYLSKYLIDKKFKIAKAGKKFSYTHQIFILTSKNEMENIFKNARKYGISLNKKEKRLFNNCGIRIGVQEITRYGWNKNDLRILSELIYLLKKEAPNDNKVKKIIRMLLRKKKDSFVLHDVFKE